MNSAPVAAPAAVASPLTNLASVTQAIAKATATRTLPSAPSTPQFARFGTWGEEISVVRDGAIHPLARQLALHPHRLEWSEDRLWSECVEANPGLMRNYRTAILDSSSFFLPAGEVVFKVVENPIQLPDNPPQGVSMRHLEAMTAYPLAKFFLLEPVFTSEPYLRLYTPEELRDEASGDRRVSQQIARHFGWAYRTAEWTKERSREMAAVALRATAWTIERLATVIGPSPRPAFPHADELSALLADETMTELVRRAEQSGLDQDARRLRRAIEELRWRTSIDPVLCFELSESPGQLWFESHWFTGIDGKRYVHY